MSSLPLVTFGIVNCNRLYYLKSCLESFLFCTQDYPNKEIIIVDNASIEEGTEEYLKEKENQGFKIIRNSKRDPSNEFARGLNRVWRESKGEYVIITQGDMQFILKNKWLHRYVELFQANQQNIGCITFDAQRKVTNESHRFSNMLALKDFGFIADSSRPPAAGAADVMYRKSILDIIGPWDENNIAHEGAGDSETKMLRKIVSLCKQHNLNWFTIMPTYPVSAGIYTDARGTNARIRKNRRYGDYWPPKEDFRYYKIHDYDELAKMEKLQRSIPAPIEEVAVPIGWLAPLHPDGSWKKQPIKPEEALPGDYIDLPYEDEQPIFEESIQKIEEETYLKEWLDSE